MELHNSVFAGDSKNSQENFFFKQKMSFYLKKTKSCLCFLQTFNIKVLLINIIKALQVTHLIKILIKNENFLLNVIK